MERILKYFLTTLLIQSLYFTSVSQSKIIDSLRHSLKNCKEDSSKIKLLNTLSNQLSKTNLDSALMLSTQAFQLAEKTGWKKGILQSIFHIGKHNYLKGAYAKALDNYLASLKIAEELKIQQTQAMIMGSIGNIYVLQGAYPKALRFYFNAMNIAESLHDKNGIASYYSNIGLAYAYSGESEKALEYLIKSLNSNIESGNEVAQATTMDFIGWTYTNQHNYSKALEYLLKSLKLNEKFGDQVRIIDNLRNIGSVYIKTGKFKEAEISLKKALEYSISMGHLHGIESVNEDLSKLYDTTGRAELAFEHYKKYIAARDSIKNDINQKKQVRTEMNYEFEKKEAVMKEQNEKERVIAEEKSRFQKIIIFSVVAGLILVIIFAGFISRTLRTTRLQKLIIEEKQREILDSIHYAKRIQSALMANENYIDKIISRLQKKNDQ